MSGEILGGLVESCQVKESRKALAPASRTHSGVGWGTQLGFREQRSIFGRPRVQGRLQI